jgi:hypothetical protein
MDLKRIISQKRRILGIDNLPKKGDLVLRSLNKRGVSRPARYIGNTFGLMGLSI